MAIKVHSYGRGVKCVGKLRYAYVRITKMERQKESEYKDMSKVMSTSIGTVS